MPHTTVEYTASLSAAMDRPGVGQAVTKALTSIVGARVEGCKTRFVRHDYVWIGEGGHDKAMVHVEIALLSGRTQETKRALTAAVIDALRQHVADMPELDVQYSASVRDLDRESYARADLPRTDG